MKPDWKNAPKWARWLAQDKDGLWWWFKFKPAGLRWITTLEKRP